MPGKSQMTKLDMKHRVLKMKNELYNGRWHEKNGDWHDGAHEVLNTVLDMIEEYVF
jgi:hypothetical protein|tara:strand:+ start:427 stop:594 length:168 start_codon:yes stop_codon:yes gene_type:complete